MFFTPVEARYVQIVPLSWQNAISVRVALLGCPIMSTTLVNELHTSIKTTITRNFILNKSLI